MKTLDGDPGPLLPLPSWHIPVSKVVCCFGREGGPIRLRDQPVPLFIRQSETSVLARNVSMWTKQNTNYL